MTRLERFFASIERRPVDRPAFWLGMPTSDAVPGLLRAFGAADMAALKEAVGDDVWPVDVPYRHPPANHIACAFDFAKQTGSDYEERTLTAPGFFEDIATPDGVDTFPWPDPAAHMDPEECRQAVESVPAGWAAMGVLWSAHFQDACSAFGMETALVRMLEAPTLFRAVIDRITDFYLRANRIFYEACGDRLHAVLIGNDFGSQTTLMVSPELLRRFVFPGTRALIEQAHRYGYRVVHHSCGAVRDILPDLIAAGADCIHPIQALATGMDAAGLRADFGHRVAFCGGVDMQELLVRGTPAAVTRKVRELRTLFPTGLILSPSHEAILPDIPPENVRAFADACRLP
ncbi:MAG: methyltransferase [Lentisphaeria bacterium]|nr:methyltransferase [Lentisphaeria bacterium]